VLAEDLRFHRDGMDLEDGCEVRPKRRLSSSAVLEDASCFREDPPRGPPADRGGLVTTRSMASGAAARIPRKRSR